MTGFARRPLAVFVCCMFAGMQTSHAALETVLTPLPRADAEPPRAVSPVSDSLFDLAANDNLPVRLRMERKFNVQGRKKAPLVPGLGIQNPADLKKDEQYPAFIIADNLEGRTNEETIAEGDVELRKAGSLLYADKAVYWPLEDEVEATGHVRLLQDGGELDTPHLRMKLSEQIGFAEQADYVFAKEAVSKFYQPQQVIVTAATSNAAATSAPMMLNVPNSYGLATVAPPTRPSLAAGHAERAEFEGENQVELTRATYSTCKPGRQDWYLRSSQMHLDFDNNVGDAKNATLWFEGVPIFYTPTASFPLSHEQRSGFLHPSFSHSTRNGFNFALPYYWAIAPNYDATFYPRYLTKNGFQLGVEAEYLDQYTRNTSRAEYLPNDELTGRQRFAYNIQHTQNFGRGFSGLVNWNGVSDDFYWTDFSSRLLQTSQTQLPKQVVLNYSPTPSLQTSMQVLHYQTLQTDPLNPIARPYFLEPQLNIIGFKPNVLNTDLSLISQFTRFTHPTQVDGDRFVFYPQISLPIVHPAFQITPKVGLHLTKYTLEQQAAGDPTSVTRVLPTISLDSTVVFEREGSFLGTEYIQTLEPRLYYVNIPYKDQSKIPVFDSALTDFNFAQIFSENRYSGFDRINDANQLTAAVTSRLLDASTGVEQFKGMIGQRYYFKPQRVTITGETARTSDFSNLVAAATGLVFPKTYADVAWEYNYHDSTSERFSAGMRYQPELGKALSASYRFTRDALTGKSTVDQIDFAGQWPISSSWYAIGRYNYSLRDRQLLEGIAGLEYNAGCWALRFVAQRVEAIAGKPNTSEFVQLELNDFASVGSNPLGMLRRSIPGYGKTNELPSSGSLLTTP
jgi:LPS-assembly protein